MKMLFFLLSGLLLVAVITPGYPAESHRYFRKIVLLGIDQRIDGKYPVGDNSSADANVYQISYDSADRPVLLKYLKHGRPAKDPLFGVPDIAVAYYAGREEISFEDTAGNLKNNSIGIALRKIELDTTDRVVAIRNFDQTGQPVNDNFGEAEIVFAAGESNGMHYTTLYDKDAKKIRHEIIRYDTLGNLVEVSFPDSSSDTGAGRLAAIEYAYDDSGNIIQRKFLGARGEPVKPGHDVWKYDRWEEMLLPLSSTQIRDAMTNWSYDSHGDMVQEDEYGADDKISGTALYAYDSEDNLAKIAYFSADGRITCAVGDWGQSSEVPPPNYFPVDTEPRIVKQVMPEYPTLAQTAGIEGRVIVKVWVDEEGDSRDALVLKSDAEILDRPSIDAAMRYKFTPAMMNGKPVPIWVVIPFTFRLR